MKETLVINLLESQSDELSMIVHERDDNFSLCGFPGICLPQAFEDCWRTSLYQCPSCGVSRATTFVVLVLIMGLFILFGNFLVIFSLYSGGKPARNKLGYTKGSLAVADMMNGLQILFVTLPNFFWTMGATSFEIAEAQLKLRGSLSAVVGGYLLTVIYISSFYHLLLISVQRFIAIKWPFFHRITGNKSTFFTLFVIWILAFIVASIPIWFPHSFVFTYNVNTFLYTPAFTSALNLSLAAKICLCLFFSIPYFVMSGFTLVTGRIVCKRLKNSRKLSGTLQKRLSLKQQAGIIKTLAYMEVGFTVTLIPNIIVSLLYYNEILDCDSVSTPFLVTFYISISNSLVNVLIYSCRDDVFKDLIRRIFGHCYFSLLSGLRLLHSKQVWKVRRDQSNQHEKRKLKSSVTSNTSNDVLILSVSKAVDDAVFYP